MTEFPWESIGTAISVIFSVAKLTKKVVDSAKEKLEEIIELRVAGLNNKLKEVQDDQRNLFGDIKVLTKSLDEIKRNQSVSEKTLDAFHSDIEKLSTSTKNALSNLEKSRVQWINETVAILRATRKKEPTDEGK